METLVTTDMGNDTWEWHLSTKEHNILSFLWSRFIKCSDDSITDYQNETKIDERVSDKTSELNEDNTLLQSKMTMLEKTIAQKESTIQAQEEHLETSRENKSKDIDQLVKKSTEHKDELINALKEHITNLSEEKKEERILNETLRTENKELNNKLHKDNNNSSYRKGVIGEKKLFELLREECEFNVCETCGENHMGDARVIYQGMSFCIDAKQYQGTVQRDQGSSKLVFDVEKNSYDGGVLISWDSGIYDHITTSKIRGPVAYQIINGRPYLFLSEASKLPDGVIISLIKELYNKRLTNEDQTNVEINEKLSSELATMIESEIKSLNNREKTRISEKSQDDKRRIVLQELKKEFKLTNNSLNSTTSSKKDIVTDICSHLHEIKQEYKTQRNSIRDIKSYLEKYYAKNEIKYEKFTESDLKKVLNELDMKGDNKHGKNYLGQQRKRDTVTWGIELCPDILN